MEFVILIVVMGAGIAAWVAYVRFRNQFATYDESTDRPLRRRSGRRRRSSSSSSSQSSAEK